MVLVVIMQVIIITLIIIMIIILIIIIIPELDSRESEHELTNQAPIQRDLAKEIIQVMEQNRNN